MVKSGTILVDVLIWNMLRGDFEYNICLLFWQNSD